MYINYQNKLRIIFILQRAASLAALQSTTERLARSQRHWVEDRTRVREELRASTQDMLRLATQLEDRSRDMTQLADGIVGLMQVGADFLYVSLLQLDFFFFGRAFFPLRLWQRTCRYARSR